MKLVFPEFNETSPISSLGLRHLPMPIPLTNADLYEIVDRENQENFRSHFCRSPRPGSISLSLGVSDRVIATSRTQTVKSFSHHGRLSGASFIGASKNGPIVQNLEPEIILKHGNPPNVGKVAIGHAIASDFGSQSLSNMPMKFDSWLAHTVESPVILVVGSNYSQGASYLDFNVPTLSRSGMARGFKILIDRILALNNPLATVLKSRANLVIANFFPWITNRAWSKLSVFEQVVLMQSHGYANPIQVIGSLFLRLKPHLLAVVFHGGPGFVHIYANEWIITYLDVRPTSPPLILFSDNLSPQGKLSGKTDAILI